MTALFISLYPFIFTAHAIIFSGNTKTFIRKALFDGSADLDHIPALDLALWT
jgi:hypothetical protein